RWIMHRRLHPAIRQVLLERVTLLDGQRVNVPGVPGAGTHGRNTYAWHITPRGAVLSCDLPAAGEPAGQVSQFHAQDRALQTLHTHVEPNLAMHVARGLRVVPQIANALRESRVVRHDGARFAVGAEVFAGIETEAAETAE